MLGLNFPSVSHFLFVAGCLVSLGGLVCVSLLAGIALFAKPKPLTIKSRRSPGIWVYQRIGPVMGQAMLLGLGYTLGQLSEKVRQSDRMNHMRNVEIVMKYDDFNYFIRSQDIGASYRVNFCTDIAPPFKVGMILDDLVYEKLSDCLRLSTGSFGIRTDMQTGKWIDYRDNHPKEDHHASIASVSSEQFGR